MTDEKPRDEWDWAHRQAALFERTNGTRGNDFRGFPIVLVTMIGAKTGFERKNPVIRVESDGDYAVIASKGGADTNPTWYYNLKAHPEVALQDGEIRRSYVAREVDGDERAQWWARGVEVYPQYADYQEKTDRVIPVFVLSPL